MANTNPITKDETNNVWPYEIEISGSGWTQTHIFSTENKFLDADIAVKAHANAAGAVTLSLTDLTSEITMGSATSGYYNPTVSLSGNANIASAGWITAGNKSVTDSSVKIGKVAQSLVKEGNTTLDLSDPVNPTGSSRTITITAGYNSARTLTIGPVSDGPKATVTSGTATLGTLTYTYDSTNTIFNISGTATISQATAPTAGYISNSAGTRNGNSNEVFQTVAVVTVGSEATGTFTKAKPVIVRTAKASGSWVDAGTGNASASATANKPYVQVDAAAVSATLTTRGKVTAAGYGTTSNFKRATNVQHDVGSLAADTVYIPIKEGTIVSPDITITIGNPSYQSSSGTFLLSANGTIDAPSVTQEGYVSEVVGTKTAGSYSGNKSLNKITVGTTISSGTSGKVTPVIKRTAKPSADTWTDAASGAETNTKPTSGVYVQVDAAKIDKTVSVQGTVTSSGYGTADSGTTQGAYTKATAQSITAGSAAAVTKYIPIKTATGYSLNVTSISGSSDVTVGTKNTTTNKYPIKASDISVTGTLSASTNGWFSSGSATDTDTDNVTIGNMAAAGFTVTGGVVTATAGYVPAGNVATIATKTPAAVSIDPGDGYTANTSVVLESGGWLKLDAGYYVATKISLATLVPDGSNVKGHAEYLLKGKTAYDNDGTLVTGTIETYGGEYTIA